VPENLRQVPKRTRLCEDVHCAEFARPVDRLCFGVSREDDNRQIREATSNTRENRKTVEPRHDEIKEDTIDRRRLQDIERFNAVEGHEDIMPFDAQYLRKHLGNRRIVLDNQYSHGALRGGSIRAEGSARQGLTFGTAHAI